MERVDFKITEEDKRDIVKRTYKFALRTLHMRRGIAAEKHRRNKS